MMSIAINTFYSSSLSVMATAPSVGSGDKVWSDRKMAEVKGNITAIRIKTRTLHSATFNATYRGGISIRIR